MEHLREVMASLCLRCELEVNEAPRVLYHTWPKPPTAIIINAFVKAGRVTFQASAPHLWSALDLDTYLNASGDLSRGSAFSCTFLGPGGVKIVFIL